MNNLIETLQVKQLVWHGSAQTPTIDTVATGYAELDKQLNGGFPTTGVIELLSDHSVGELRLLLPSITRSTHRLLVFIAPPGTVNAQMLVSEGALLENTIIIYPKDKKDRLWAAEQSLKSGACNAVVLWTNDHLETHQIKRLQLASAKGRCPQFILRTTLNEALSLPVDLSLSLNAHHNGLIAKVNKRKRGWPTRPFKINMQNRWPKLTQKQQANNLLHFPNTKVG